MTLLAFIAPVTARNLILTVVGIGYLVYHIVRWSKVRSPRSKVQGSRFEVQGPKSKVQSEIGERKEEIGNREGQDQREVKDKGQGQQRNEESISRLIEYSNNRMSQTAQTLQTLQTPQTPIPQPSTPEGEALFRRARAMKHQMIPDYRVDGLYLDMLGDAAAAGCTAAMAKLGEYAMRRGTWIEAYYWMSLAKRHGMPNLDAALRDVRRKWMMAGSPDEEGNVYELFSKESGSIGRALLHIASGLDAANARRFLKAHRPDLLDGAQ